MAAYERRDIRGGAVATTLDGGITSGDATFTLAASSGWPDGGSGDFFVVFDRGNANEEKVRCASRTSLTVTVQTSGRGVDGTSAAAHASGVTVEHCVTATDLDEANYTVNKTVGKVSAQGDLLVGDTANSLARLAKGTQGYPLVAGASTLSYAQLTGTGIATDAVDSAQIAANAVGTSELASNAVTTAKITDANVTTAKINDLAVTTAKIANAAVTETQLATSVAGSGLAGGAGTALSVGVDGSSIEITADTLNVKAGGVTGAMLNSGVVDDSTIAISSNQLIVKDAGLTSAKFASEAGTSWTPTVSGTGWAIGNGTVVGLYVKHGRLVFAQGKITSGSTTTFGTGALVVGGLPVVVNSSIGISGRVFINDASSGTDFYGDWAVAASGSSGTMYNNSVFSTPGAVFRQQVDSTHPMTWANGDSLEFSIWYIAAS